MIDLNTATADQLDRPPAPGPRVRDRPLPRGARPLHRATPARRGARARGQDGRRRGAGADRIGPAPTVSPLYLQDVAYERAIGDSADRRHHVRFWQVRPGVWAGAASLDRGVGLSLYTLEVTHHIGPDVDAERAASGRILAAAGGREAGSVPNRIPARIAVRNGGGDRYRTDGRIAAWAFAPTPAPGR